VHEPDPSESALDTARRLIGEAITVFDPFRFRTWAELGLTTAQLRVLFMMRHQPGVTAGELATRLSVTPPTISGIVDRLVRLGLVRREDDATDRRLVRNSLTTQGEFACTRLERGGELFTRRLLVEMHHDDLEKLIVGLRAFVKASEAAIQNEPNLAAVAMPGVNSE
jgi:DNA-binding MarR family transcriptional regulator